MDSGQKLIDAWNSSDLEAMAGLFAPNSRYADLGFRMRWDGFDSVREMCQQTFDGPDFKMRYEGGFSDDRLYVVEWSFILTYEGQKRSGRGASVGTFDDQGKILENHDYANPEEMAPQTEELRPLVMTRIAWPPTGMDWGQKLIDAWNSYDAEAMAAFYGANARYADLGFRMEFEGLDALREMFQMTFKRFPDFKMRYEGGFSDDRHYAVEWSFILTSDGQEYSGRGLSMGTFDDQGKILENHDCSNPAEYPDVSIPEVMSRPEITSQIAWSR